VELLCGPDKLKNVTFAKDTTAGKMMRITSTISVEDTFL
jgi:hypothetical protein